MPWRIQTSSWASFLSKRSHSFSCGLERRLLSFEERVVVARPVEQLPPVDLDDPRGQPAQQHAVVRDEQQRLAHPEQIALQPGDRVDVQMVRRLIQQEQIGFAHQRRRQQHPPLLTARKGRVVPVGVQAHAGRDARDFFEHRPRTMGVQLFVQLVQPAVVGIRMRRQPRFLAMIAHHQLAALAQAPRDDLEDRALEVTRDRLREVRDLQSRFRLHGPRIRDDLSGEDLHQRRLAGPIAAQQTDPLLLVDLKTDPIQQRGPAKGDTDLLQRYQCHRIEQSRIMSIPASTLGNRSCYTRMNFCTLRAQRQR